ncbi:MAG: hypothetical protein HY081_03120 [Gammaproteobacteria bacterium]|nr:hypothetical protein [Gammaproteobacteria bacterium]
MAKYGMAFSQALDLNPDDPNGAPANDADLIATADSSTVGEVNSAAVNDAEAPASENLSASQKTDEAEGILELAAWLQRKVGAT